MTQLKCRPNECEEACACVLCGDEGCKAMVTEYHCTGPVTRDEPIVAACYKAPNLQDWEEEMLP